MHLLVHPLVALNANIIVEALHAVDRGEQERNKCMTRFARIWQRRPFQGDAVLRRYVLMRLVCVCVL